VGAEAESELGLARAVGVIYCLRCHATGLRAALRAQHVRVITTLALCVDASCEDAYRAPPPVRVGTAARVGMDKHVWSCATAARAAAAAARSNYGAAEYEDSITLVRGREFGPCPAQLHIKPT
jgi:hypothetical protein